MDAPAIADQPPMIPLLRRPVGQSGIPGNGRGNRPTVTKLHGQSVLVDVNISGSWDLCFSR